MAPVVRCPAPGLLPVLALALAVACVPIGRPASADPTPGFTEHWAAGSGTAGWGGGDTYANPGTGGELGGADGFLQFSTPGPAPFNTLNLGTTTSATAYLGNWVAAGITHVQFWLNDVGAQNSVEIHFSIGSSTNFWQYDAGFIPPVGSWAPFTVDLTTGPAGWTQIINTTSGTFSQALQSVDKILIRHDKAPFVQTPDPVTADVGLDELALLAGPVTAVAPAARVPRAVQLAAPWPNPSRAAVTLTFESFDDSPVRVEIVDAAGRRVRHVERAATAGPQRWTWDGRSDAGAPVSAGSYRARAFSASGGTSRPFVWLGGR